MYPITFLSSAVHPASINLNIEDGFINPGSWDLITDSMSSYNDFVKINVFFGSNWYGRYMDLDTFKSQTKILVCNLTFHC